VVDQPRTATASLPPPCRRRGRFGEIGDQKVPVGFGRDGHPVYLNFEFVDGTRGGHVSISGVSGIATKTSFALFLLHSIIHCGVLAAEAHNTKMLVFSVKGEDLLFLDYANQRLSPDQRKRYEELGLPATPFQNVRVFAPPRRGDQSGTPDVAARDKAISPFYRSPPSPAPRTIRRRSDVPDAASPGGGCPYRGDCASAC
jgi:hypothetical protein